MTASPRFIFDCRKWWSVRNLMPPLQWHYNPMQDLWITHTCHKSPKKEHDKTPQPSTGWDSIAGNTGSLALLAASCTPHPAWVAHFCPRFKKLNRWIWLEVPNKSDPVHCCMTTMRHDQSFQTRVEFYSKYSNSSGRPKVWSNWEALISPLRSRRNKDRTAPQSCCLDHCFDAFYLPIQKVEDFSWDEKVFACQTVDLANIVRPTIRSFLVCCGISDINLRAYQVNVISWHAYTNTYKYVYV